MSPIGRPPRRRAASQVRFSPPLAAGPFRGMRDSFDPTTADPALASLLLNCYPAGPNADVVGRPGFRQLGVHLAGRGQGVRQFTRVGGTTFTVVVAGGKFYTVNWLTRTVTEVLTAAHLSAASVALSPTARVALVPFNQGSDYQLVVSDGVNTPWMWDGTAGGGITKLTNCPVLYGPPTVYYGKLFGIKAADRTVMVWSSEADATTGYEMAAYLYNWQLRQSDPRALTRLFGTNDALYVFRERSITTVSGRVTPDFQTFGVRDGVSGTLGTASPWAVEQYDQTLFFLDADGRPQALPIGGRVVGSGSGEVGIWNDLRETTQALPPTSLAKATAVFDSTVGLLKYAVVEESATDATLTLCYAPWQAPPQAAALFRGYTAVEMAMCLDVDSQPVFVHLSADGYVYDHGTPRGSVWNDGLAAASAAVLHTVRTPHLAPDTQWEKYFERVDVTCRTATNMTGVTVSAETPYGVSAPQTVNFVGTLTLWGTMVWGDDWSSASIEVHQTWGAAERGRWLRVVVQHQALNEQFGFGTLQVQGHLLTNEPTAA